MRTHFYLHTSDLSKIQEMKRDVHFENCYYYDIYNFQNCHRNEIGRIVTDTSYFHILVGGIPQKGCPWCSSPTQVKKLSDGGIVEPMKYCIECMHCGSRGPILCINPSQSFDQLVMDEYFNFMNQRYENRVPWDKNLNLGNENV